MAEVVAENLATNPSFEEASGEVVVRENIFPDPDFTTTDWVRLFQRCTVTLGGGKILVERTSDGGASGPLGGASATAGSVSEGDVITASARRELLDGAISTGGTEPGQLRLRFRDAQQNDLGVELFSSLSLTDEDAYASVTATAPAGADSVELRFHSGGATGDKVTWSEPLIEKGSERLPFFGPTTPASGDFTYRERPGGGAQEVAQGVAGVTVGWQSSLWAKAGTKSLHIPEGSVQEYALTDQTLVITPRDPNQTVLVDDQPRTAGAIFRYQGTANIGLADGWWDCLLIVEGTYDGPYFDGDTPNTATHKYVWTGQPNASTSQALLVTASDFNLPPGENIRSTLAKYIWFGNQRVQQWLPMPSSGTQASYEYAVGGGGLANGGFHARRSSGFHKTYQFDFAVREADQWNGIEGYNRFASGIDSGIISSGGGTGSGIGEGVLFRFCDPMIMGRNMFTPQWAAPQLCNEFEGEGFHDIAPTRGDTYVTPQNTRHYPATAPYWDLTASDSASVSRQPEDGPRHTFKLLVPPTHVLYLGFVGVVTGAGAIFVEKRFRDGTSGVETITELIDPTSGDGLGSLMVDGSEVAYVTMWLGSTSPGSAAQVALVASTAIELPYWEAPDMSTGGWWTEGLGHSGLEFGDGAFVETYEVAVQGGRGRYLKGMSTSLVEVGAWR